MKYPHSLLLIASLAVATAWADEMPNAEPAAPPASPSSPHSLFLRFSGGPTSSNSGTYTVKTTQGTTVTETKDKGRNAWLIEGEIERRTEGSPFGIAGAMGINPYLYTNEGTPDVHFHTIGIGKVHLGGGNTQGWLGLGVGMGSITIGDTAASTGSTSIVIDKSAYGFVITPRFGIEQRINNFTLFAQASYFSNWATLNGAISTATESTKFREDVSRSWWSFAVGVGLIRGN